MSQFNNAAMSCQPPAQTVAPEANPNQPLSNYANQSITFNQHQGGGAQDIPEVDNESIQLHQQLMHRFHNVDPRILVGGHGNGFLSRAANAAVRPPTYYPPQAMAHPVPQPLAHETVTGGAPNMDEKSFWTKRAQLRLPDGQYVRGSFADLYSRYPDVSDDIWRHYHVWHADEAQKAMGIQLKRHYGSRSIASKADVGESANKDGRASKKSRTPRKKARIAAPAASSLQAPAYAPDADLDTPQKCRDYLAYPDPADIHALTFANDDWQDVLNNRKHEFIGEIFGALTYAYSPTPPTNVVLTEQARVKYRNQQQTQTAKVIALLQTPCQIKAAKALCSLLFDAAVYIHQTGISKETWEGHQWYTRKERQVDRKYRIDIGTICSARMEKIVHGIKANKLIAIDVLEHTNFHRIARDPDFYLLEKFTYLRSNKTRQENIDRYNKLAKDDPDAGGIVDVMGHQSPRVGETRGRSLEEEADTGESDRDGEEEKEYEQFRVWLNQQGKTSSAEE